MGCPINTRNWPLLRKPTRNVKKLGNKKTSSPSNLLHHHLRSNSIHILLTSFLYYIQSLSASIWFPAILINTVCTLLRLPSLYRQYSLSVPSHQFQRNRSYQIN